MKSEQIKLGQRIYNRGDMANVPHFGTITKVDNDRWGCHVWITPDEDAERKPYSIPAVAISEVDKGHGGTRIVTIEAYNRYRDEAMAAYKR